MPQQTFLVDPPGEPAVSAAPTSTGEPDRVCVLPNVRPALGGIAADRVVALTVHPQPSANAFSGARFPSLRR